MSFLDYASSSESEFRDEQAREEARDYLEGLEQTRDEYAWAFPEGDE